MIKFKVKIMLAVRDMTQKELAEKTGIRPPTISAICLGTIKQLPIEGLNKICKALDCQPSDLMEYIEQGSQTPGESMWDVNIFGKTLEQLVGDGMQTKALKMTDESQQKLQDTMEKIINESNGGLVCIII